MAQGGASQLVDTTRAQLEPLDRALREHAYLEAAAERRLDDEDLRAFVGEQYAIIQSDELSFNHLAGRYADTAAGGFFLDLAKGEAVALAHLETLAVAIVRDRAGLDTYEPMAGAQAYKAHVAWLALSGSSADVALAFVTNLAAWGACCERLGASLREGYSLSEEAVGFFTFFSTPPPDFEERALAVIDAGLAAGDSPANARRAARLLQAYELLYWDTLDAARARRSGHRGVVDTPAPIEPTAVEGAKGYDDPPRAGRRRG